MIFGDNCKENITSFETEYLFICHGAGQLTVSQLVNVFPAFYGNQNYTIAYSAHIHTRTHISGVLEEVTANLSLDVKVKLYQCAPWRRMGEKRYSAIHS